MAPETTKGQSSPDAGPCRPEGGCMRVTNPRRYQAFPNIAGLLYARQKPTVNSIYLEATKFLCDLQWHGSQEYFAQVDTL